MRKAALFIAISMLSVSTLLAGFIIETENTASGTEIPGQTITVNTNWDFAGSPYYIQGDVFIESEAVLTVDPGVVVQFNSSDGDVGLFVNNGTLNAIGTPTNKIYFTSNWSSPWNGDWDRIYVGALGHANISYCNISYASFGLYMEYTNNNTIENSILSHNSNHGIIMRHCSGNSIRNNSILGNFLQGVHLYSSTNNIIENNTLRNNFRGIYGAGASGDETKLNNIKLNRIYSNFVGIRLLSFADENNVTGNNISENSNFGMDVTGNDNRIFHNTFWNNSGQANDDGIGNLWDNGYPSGGNYWSDFDEGIEGAYDNNTGPNQDEPDADGIVDDPYVNITGSAGSMDDYPLMNPGIARTFVYLTSPINNSVILPGALLDFAVVGKDIALVNYSINGSANVTLSSPYDINDTETGSWTDGPYVVQIFVYDGMGGETGFSFNLTVDTQLPEIILNSPDNATLIARGTVIDLNIVDDNFDFAYYTLNGGPNITLSSPLFDISSGTWGDDNNEIQVYAVDKAGNMNTTMFNFTVDGTPPVIDFITPGNESFVNSDTLLVFNITDDHLNISSIEYFINGTGPYTFAEPYNISTTGWSDDLYTIKITAEDILGNVKTNWFNVTIDDTPPVITYVPPPLNNSVFHKGEILDFEILDDNIDIVFYRLNFQPPLELVPTYNLDTSTWEDNLYRIDIDAYDLAGNYQTNYFFFTVATPPTITLTFPANGSMIKGDVGSISFWINDTNLLHANYSKNGGTNLTLDPPYNILTLGWSSGVYQIDVHAIDTAGNSNSKMYVFTVDSTNPTVTLNTTNLNYVFVPGTLLDFEIYDEYLDTVTNSTDGGSYNTFPWPYDLDTTGWEDGTYSFIVRARDEAGNENLKEFLITIDSELPQIILISPQNGTSGEIGGYVNLSIIDDNLDLVQYSINSGVNQTISFPFSIDTDDFPDGNVILTIYAYDLAGNFNTSWYEFIFNDTTAPYITVISPQNNSHVPEGFIIDFDVFDQYLEGVTYSIDGSAFSDFVSPYDIDTTGWDEGLHEVVIDARDTRNNINISTFFFTIDSEEPLILTVSPANNSALLPGGILDFVVVEDNLYSANYSVNGQDASPLAFPFDINTTDWEDDIYNILITAVDHAGNSNMAVFRFIVDSLPPDIQLSFPEDGSAISAGTFINITIVDANPTTTVYSIDDGVLTTLLSPHDIDTSGLPDGNHTFFIRSNDSLGNEAEVTFVFTMDSTPPEGQIFVSAPFYPYNFTRIQIYFTESMDRESVEAALDISPALNYTIAWYDEDKTLMLMDIAGLQLNEYYTIDLGEGATDLAGNSIHNLSSYGFRATIDIDLDTDQDGIPDGWEFFHGFNPYDPSDSDDDPDDDGYTNEEEFVGGSDPRDANSIPIKQEDEGSTLQYWWLIPILIGLLIISLILFVLLVEERKEEPKGPVEQVEDIYLAMRAQRDIEAMEKMLKREELLGENIQEAQIMVRKAKEAFEKGDYNVITVYEKTLRDLVGEESELEEETEAEEEPEGDDEVSDNETIKEEDEIGEEEKE